MVKLAAMFDSAHSKDKTMAQILSFIWVHSNFCSLDLPSGNLGTR